MTVLGWVFLTASLAFVWGLTLWCFYRVFTLPPEEGQEVEETPEESRTARPRPR
jgi:hypothetical protein